jgi:hypothetical protein
MAIIELNKKRKSSGGYKRMIGNERIANLLTACQAAVISTGCQIAQKLIESYSGNLPIFFGKDVNSPSKTLKTLKLNPKGVIIFSGYIKDVNGKKQEVDVLIFDGEKIFLGEIKEGDNLDTKKSEIEINDIENAVKYFTSNEFKTTGALILMNMFNKYHSIKDSRANEYIISGQDFCEIFEFDFQKFLNIQKNETSFNKDRFLNEAIQILKEEGML